MRAKRMKRRWRGDTPALSPTAFGRSSWLAWGLGVGGGTWSASRCIHVALLDRSSASSSLSFPQAADRLRDADDAAAVEAYYPASAICRSKVERAQLRTAWERWRRQAAAARRQDRAPLPWDEDSVAPAPNPAQPHPQPVPARPYAFSTPLPAPREPLDILHDCDCDGPDTARPAALKIEELRRIHRGLLALLEQRERV